MLLSILAVCASAYPLLSILQHSYLPRPALVAPLRSTPFNTPTFIPPAIPIFPPRNRNAKGEIDYGIIPVDLNTMQPDPDHFIDPATMDWDLDKEGSKDSETEKDEEPRKMISKKETETINRQAKISPFFGLIPTESELVTVKDTILGIQAIPHRIHYEIYGQGPQKIVLVMGFISPMSAWKGIVQHYVKQNKYSIMVLDNRGMGESTTGMPGPYTIPGMANDVLAVLKHANWKKDLNLVGFSMGGMIAMHLAATYPDTSKDKPAKPVHLEKKIDAQLPSRDPRDIKIDSILETAVSVQWLDSYDPEYPQYASNRIQMREWVQDYWKKYPIINKFCFVGQGAAIWGHQMTKKQLNILSQMKVAAITGGLDQMIHPKCTDEIADAIKGCVRVLIPNAGHSLMIDNKNIIISLMDTMMECKSGIEEANKEGSN